MKKLDYHEIADCFPMLEDELLEELANDINENGLIRPIVLFEDKILDGRNRYEACLRAKVEPKTTKFVGDFKAAVAFVTSENIHRRHLTESQRAWAANKISSLKPGRPKGGPETASIEAVSQAEAAKQLNVGRSAVQRAKKVADKGVPELGDAVAKGEVKVSAAAEVAKLPKQEQEAVVKAGPEVVRETAAELRKIRGTGERVLAPRSETSTTRLALQRARDAGRLISSMVLAVKQIEAVVEMANGLKLDDMQEQVAWKSITRMKAGVAFLESSLKGEVQTADQALAKWLSEGKN